MESRSGVPSWAFWWLRWPSLELLHHGYECPALLLSHQRTRGSLSASKPRISAILKEMLLMVAHWFYGAASLWGRVGRQQDRQCCHSCPAVAVVTFSSGFLLDHCPWIHSEEATELTRCLVHRTRCSQRSSWNPCSASHCSEIFPLLQKEGFRSPSAGHRRPRGLTLGALHVGAAQGPPSTGQWKPGKHDGHVVGLVLRKVLLSFTVWNSTPLPCWCFWSSGRLRKFNIES